MSDRKPGPWKVRSYTMDSGAREWVAEWKEDGDYLALEFFPTHAEAIAYADRQARTHPVYVPPVRDQHMIGPAWGWRTIVARNSRGWVTINNHDIPHHHVLPLAQVLLAHHGKAQAND